MGFWVLDYQDGGGAWFPWTAMGLAFGFFVVLVCCGEMARRHPWNMILLLLFTAFEGVFLGSIAARYACNAPSSVLYTCPPSQANCRSARSTATCATRRMP